MRYLCLGYHDEVIWQAMPDSERKALLDETFAALTKVHANAERNRMNAKELFEWIDGGAQIYICGCKDPMSYDVEKTLLDIIAQEKNVSAESANEYLDTMKEAGRYHKDVY